MTATWLGSYAFNEDHTTIATLADPVAIAIERGYGADDISRAAFVRNAARNAEAARMAALREDARIANRRAHRLDAAVRRLQPVLDMVHAGLRERKAEAVEQRDHARAASIDRQIDAVFSEFNKLAQGLVEDLR